MKRLILVEETGPRAGREHGLERGELSLGRDEGSGVRFAEGEGGVSRRHAVIRAQEGGFYVGDLKSANGTFVNDRRIESAWLATGDVIGLGEGGPRLRVRVVESGPAGTPATPPAAREPAAGGPGRDRRSVLADSMLFDPTRHVQRRSALAVLVVVGMMVIGVGAGMLVALLTAFELGPRAALVGVVVAFAPAPVYLALWLWLDRYDPEPAWALAGALLWGAGAATFVSSIVNSIFGAAMHRVTGDAAMSQFLSASLSAPVVEEAAKGLAVLLIFLVLRREFDGVLDGIVYAGVVALGFAAVENVLYYGRSIAQGGAGQLVFVFVLRGILGPFGHAVYTAMTGIGCGIARQSHNPLVRVAAPVCGYAAAVFLHFLWNTLAGLSGGPAGFLLIYVLLWIPLFLAFLALVLWMGHRESALIGRMLQPEVALGLLTAEQAAVASSWPRRVAWLFAAVGDADRFQARRRFLQSATRLALSYWHAERAASAGGHTISAGLIPAFRTEVARLKAQV